MVDTAFEMPRQSDEFTSNIGDLPKGEDFVFTIEDIDRFKKYDLDVDFAISQGATKEEVVDISKEIEQEDLYKQQVSEQAPPGIQSIPVNPSTIPPATPPQDDGFFNMESEALDFAKLGGQVLSNIVSNVAGFGLEKTGEYVENQTLYNLGKYIKERSHEISADLGNSLSEGGKRDVSRTIWNIPPERKGIPDITQDQVFGDANIGTILGLGTQAIGSMGPTLKLAQPIAKALGKVPGVQAVERATGVGVSGAGGLAGAAGTIEGMNSASDAYRDAMSATDEEIVQSPLYKSMEELIAPNYPNSSRKELIDFTRHQVANQVAWEIGTKAGGLVAATSFPFGSFLGRMGVLGGGKLGNQYKQGMTKAFWTGAKREGGQEFIQEGGQQLLGNYGSYLAGKSPEAINFEGVIEGASKGLVGGTTVGGPLGAYADMGLERRPVDAPTPTEPDPPQPTQEETAKEVDKQRVYDEHIRAWEQANQRPYDQHVKDFDAREQPVDERVFPQDQQVRDFNAQFGQGDTQQDAQVEAYRKDYQREEQEKLPVRSDRLRELQRKSDKEATGGTETMQGSFDQQVKAYEQYADDPRDLTEEDENAPDQPSEDSDIPPFEENVDPEFKRKERKARSFVASYKTPRGVVESTNINTNEVLALANDLGIDTTDLVHKKGKKKGKPKSGAKGKASQRIFDWVKENTTSPFEGQVQKSKRDVGLTRTRKGKSKASGWIDDNEDLSDLTEEQLKDRKRLERKDSRWNLKKKNKRFAGLYRAKSKWVELFNDPELGDKFLSYLDNEGTMGLDEEGNQDPTQFTPASKKTDIPEGKPIKKIGDSDLVLRAKKKAVSRWAKDFRSVSNLRSNFYNKIDAELNAFMQKTYRRSDLGEITEGAADQLVAQEEARLMKLLKEKSTGWLKKATDSQKALEASSKKYGYDISSLQPLLSGFAQELNIDAKDLTFLNQQIADESRDFTNDFKEMFPDLSLDKDGEFREVGVKKSGDAKKQLDAWAADETEDPGATGSGTESLSEMEQREKSEGFGRLQDLMGGESGELGVNQQQFRADKGAEFTKAEIERMIRLGQTLTNNAKQNKLNKEDVKFFRQLIGLDEDGNVPLEKIKALQESERRKVLKLFGELVQRARSLGIEIDIPRTPRGKAWLGAMLGGAEGFASLPKPPLAGEKRGTNPFQVKWDEVAEEYIMDDAPDWAKKANGQTDEFGRTISDLVLDTSSGNWVAKPRWMMVEEGLDGRKKRDLVDYNEETGAYDPVEDQTPATKITSPQLSKYYPMKLSISDVGSIKTIEIIVDDGSMDGQLIGIVEVAIQDMEATDLTGWQAEKKTFKEGELLSANFNMARNKYGIDPRDINIIVANAIGTSVVKMANSGLSENFFNFRKNARESLKEIDRKFTNEGDTLLTTQYDQVAYIIENSDPKTKIDSEEWGEPQFRYRLGGERAVPKEGEVADSVTERQYLYGEEQIEQSKESEGEVYSPYTEESQIGEETSDDLENLLFDSPVDLTEQQAIQEEIELGGDPTVIKPSEPYTDQTFSTHVKAWEKSFDSLEGEGIIPLDENGEPIATQDETEFYYGAATFNQEETALDKNINNTAQDETDLTRQCRGKGKGKKTDDDDDLANLEF